MPSKDYSRIFEAMQGSFLWDGIREAVDEFNLPPDEGGFDWKFWDEDNDAYPGWVAEVKHNAHLAGAVIEAVIEGVDNLADEFAELQTDEGKVDAAAAFIASFFDIPWVPESIEQMLVKHLLAAALDRLDMK